MVASASFVGCVALRDCPISSVVAKVVVVPRDAVDVAAAPRSSHSICVAKTVSGHEKRDGWHYSRVALLRSPRLGRIERRTLRAAPGSTRTILPLASLTIPGSMLYVPYQFGSSRLESKAGRASSQPLLKHHQDPDHLAVVARVLRAADPPAVPA